MSLSEKTDEELANLLSEYGIKHGPIVDSTRKLYERKLEEAMKETPEQPTSDRLLQRGRGGGDLHHLPQPGEAGRLQRVLEQRNHSEPEDQEEDQQEDQGGPAGGGGPAGPAGTRMQNCLAPDHQSCQSSGCPPPEEGSVRAACGRC
ncbi:lamina-associated polypeptide 2, isoforms beta/gamma [Salarias fasciatus]|uniref:lamina-associated polypeptide 2, isoforms beta/gamma n=1 Tax=Salarias fasciatus TaxID=181472 RepID=UPI0011769094|nr:emerin [Salarias fasciatus]